MLRFRTAVLATVIALGAARAGAQGPWLDMSAGDLHFKLDRSRNTTLTLRDVPVIQESRLYIMEPGWAGALLNQDTVTPTVSRSTENGVQIGTADYDTADAWAKYRFEVHPDNTFKVALRFASKGAPAIVEYDAGYLNANLLGGKPFTATTVDGDRSGTVPLFAASADQTESKLTPNFTDLSVDTVIGRMSIHVEGSDDITKSLTLFDARAGTQSWAHRNPIFWLGIGVPAPPLPPGEHSITITYKFGMPNPNVTIPAADGGVKIQTIPQAMIPYAPERPIIPRPKGITTGKGAPVRLSGETEIVIPDEATEEEKQGAREIRRELKDFWGVESSIQRASSSKAHTAALSRIVLTRPNAITQWFGKADSVKHPEGYTVTTSGSAVIVNGSDARGVYNGAQTIKQLLRVDANGVYVKNASIRDWPSLPFRGVHWFGGPHSQPFHKKMLDRIIAPLKMNAMVFQADYTQWATQPDIWSPERSTPKADVRETVADARRRFIEPIPLINTLGHSEWLFWNKQNLDIAADPTTPYAYNPDNPRTYDVVLPIMQEAINLFHPKYFHIGHDEVTMTGKFPPEGSTKSSTDLIVQDTLKLHEWLKRRGIQTMMWGDMLLYKDEATDAGLAPTKEDAKARRAALPKDIIIADWHYQGSDPSFPSVEILQKEGFKVIGTTWFDWGNIQNFSRVLNEEKSDGLLQSTWAGYAMSLDSLVGQELPQFVAYLVGAEYAWNGGTPDVKDLGYSPDDAFLAFWNRAPVSMARRPGFTVDLSAQSNTEMWGWTPTADAPPAGIKPTDLPTPRATLGGITFDTGSPVWMAGALNPAGAWPKSITIPLNGRKASSLHFLWGTTFTAPVGTPVADVKVGYADGAEIEIPSNYGGSIFAFEDQRAGVLASAVWRGNNPFGQPTTIRDFGWTNPHSEKPIRSVVITSRGGEAAPVLLGLTGVS